jgi:alpha/beta superfamily hydrolase
MKEQPVTFQVNGEQLVGMLHLPAQLPAPGVCLFHGFTGHKGESHRLFVTCARALAEAGLIALRFDFRGSGDSSGEFHEMTLAREVEDAQAALTFLAEQQGVLPHKLGTIGLSLGGAVAALVAGLRPSLRATVLWAAVADPGKHLSRIALQPRTTAKGFYDLGGNLVSPDFLADLPSHKPLEAIASYPGALLVVHGTSDESVPFSDSEDFVAAHLQGVTEQLAIQDSDHVFSSEPWTEEAIAASVAFLTRYLNN